VPQQVVRIAVLLFEMGRAQVAEIDGGLGTVVREQLELDIFAVDGFAVGKCRMGIGGVRG